MIQLTPDMSVTLSPLLAKAGTVQRAVEGLVRLGVRAVQLSAACKGIRPRELDRQGRRDLLALLARNGLMLGGLDLMIPHKDYLQGSTQDRAVGSVLAAIELAADLGRVPLSLSLPITKLPADVASALVQAADGRGVMLAIHAENELDAFEPWLKTHDTPLVCAAVDPAALLAQGREPAAVAMRLADRLGVARLDDYVETSVASAGGRCTLGRGELDLTAYRAALATARKLRGLVLELRDVQDPEAALATAVQAWEKSLLRP